MPWMMAESRQSRQPEERIENDAREATEWNDRKNEAGNTVWHEWRELQNYKDIQKEREIQTLM